MGRFRTFCALFLLAIVAGCAAPKPNPSFDLSVDEADALLDEMREAPQCLERPLIVLGGWIDPGIVATGLQQRLGHLCDDDRIAHASFAFLPSFDVCREKVITLVDERFPSDDPEWTTEVDVIGISMGGLVARYAAAPQEGQRRLRVARLFTIATPHQGAQMAPLPTLDRLQIDMRPGSDFLAALEAADADYEIIPYVRLGDWIVGADKAAPPGQVAWWVPNRPFEFAHTNAWKDPRILADILLRLRHEPPRTEIPREPLPREG